MQYLKNQLFKYICFLHTTRLDAFALQVGVSEQMNTLNSFI